MKEFLDLLVKSIVDSQDSIKIVEETKDEGIVLRLSVAKDDMGKLIGKNGRVIKSIRNLLKVKAIKENKRVFLDLHETD